MIVLVNFWAALAVLQPAVHYEKLPAGLEIHGSADGFSLFTQQSQVKSLPKQSVGNRAVWFWLKSFLLGHWAGLLPLPPSPAAPNSSRATSPGGHSNRPVHTWISPFMLGKGFKSPNCRAVAYGHEVWVGREMWPDPSLNNLWQTLQEGWIWFPNSTGGNKWPFK